MFLVCTGKAIGSGCWLFDDIVSMDSYEPKPVLRDVGKSSRGVSLFTVWSFVLMLLAYVLCVCERRIVWLRDCIAKGLKVEPPYVDDSLFGGER